VDSVKPTAFQRGPDRTPSKAQCSQLRARDKRPLAAGDRGDLNPRPACLVLNPVGVALRFTIGGKGTVTVPFSAITRFAPIVAGFCTVAAAADV
jgi:hypothetical protein